MHWLERVIQSVEKGHGHVKRKKQVKSKHRSKGTVKEAGHKNKRPVRNHFIDDEAVEVSTEESDPIPELGFVEILH